jgi:hypothetical protein
MGLLPADDPSWYEGTDEPWRLKEPRSPQTLPETPRQARTWETVKNSYVLAGLCIACASQAAYGHQLGFSYVRPPCFDCRSIVAAHPEPAGNGWRKFRKGDRARAEAISMPAQPRPMPWITVRLQPSSKAILWRSRPKQETAP